MHNHRGQARSLIVACNDQEMVEDQNIYPGWRQDHGDELLAQRVKHQQLPNTSDKHCHQVTSMQRKLPGGSLGEGVELSV